MATLEEFFPLRRYDVKPGPDRMESLLRTQEGQKLLAQPAVLVVGTNGKGTTSLLLEAILRQADIKVGTYTSPHFIDPRERIRIHGHLVSEERALWARNKVVAWRDAFLPDASFFELTTAIALLCFAAEGCELLVIEAGLGGRLDSTNALQPLMTILTSVGLDHTDRLGSTLHRIAFEKAMATRRRRPLVTGYLDPEAARGVTEAVQLTGAHWVRSVSENKKHGEQGDPLAPRCRNATTLLDALPHLEQALATHHLMPLAQKLNGLRRELGTQQGRHWLETYPLPGRCHTVHVFGQDLILDTAHNPAAARALVAELCRHPLLGQTQKQGHKALGFELVFGSLVDKDYEATFRILAEQSTGGLVLTFAHEASLDESLAQGLSLLTGKECPFAVAPIDALATWLEARRASSNHLRPLVVAGSFALIGQIMEKLRISPEGNRLPARLTRKDSDAAKPPPSHAATESSTPCPLAPEARVTREEVHTPGLSLNCGSDPLARDPATGARGHKPDKRDGWGRLL